jgi:serine/threonine protein kinase
MHCAHCGTPTDELPCTSCGQEPRVVGRYRLEHMLGQGAHGTTWRAVDDQTGEARAVKELPLRLGTPEKVVTLFRREASVLRQLDHPGVPVCHDAIEVGAGRQRTIWIVLDLVDGPSLHREMEGHRYDEGEVLGIMGELLEILDYLHNLSPPVVHRDIKPANVLRGPDGSLVLVDFGSVRDALRQSDLGGSTVAGTFGYMAPEQFAGDAEPATDLYGLGALAVHLLTREAPHNLQDRAGDLDFRSHLRVSDGLATLLDRLLAREPGDRPRSAASALELVRRIQAGEDLPDHGGDGETTDPTPAPVTGPADLAAAPRSRGSAEAPLAQPLTPSPPAGPFRLAVTASARRRLTVQDHAGEGEQHR